MTDDKSSDPTENPPPGAESAADTIDFAAILNGAKEVILNPMATLEGIRAMLTSSKSYFSRRMDGGVNASLGFFLIVTAVMLVFGVLQTLFSLQFIGFLLVTPTTLIRAVLYLVIGSALVHLIAITLGQSKEDFWKGVIVVSRLYWVLLIPAFPLWVFLPGLFKALIVVAAYALWAYLAIPAVGVRYAITNGKHAIAVWALCGVFSVLVLLGALTGRAVEKAGDYYGKQAEELQREAMATVEAAQKLAIAELEKARLAAESQLAELEARKKSQEEATGDASAAK